MPDLPSGTVTFLFTDVEGSTRLLHGLGAARYAGALAEHRRVVREACAAHGGVEVDTQGDAFFVAFPTARGALAAAAELTAALASGPIRVRIGIHTGTPLLTDEGYVGEDVHLGARIAAAGHGGQVLLSRQTRDVADPNAMDLGEHRLKDFAEPVWIFQLGGDRFPPLKTISNTNLPHPASSFIGRDDEVDEVVALLRSDVRLLTLTGPGGSGKTRLAVESAAELVPAFRNGVFWVGLASLRDHRLVLGTIGQTIGANDDPTDHIAERELLLVLDNFEQVVEAAPDLAALVEACPNLKVLVTSREILRVRGEVEYPVSPLAESDAIELFCARARMEPDDIIRALCRALDNLPLALELAAARAGVLSPRQIHERLSERLDLLKGGRDADPRQRTLRATIEWSDELLTPAERRLFARLAIFAGGCTLEAAEDVADAELDVVQSLVDKSLVRHIEMRFWMLETIRDYAGERLEASGEAAEIRNRHARSLLVLAEAAEPHLDRELSRGGRAWSDRMELELDNFRAALDWLESVGEDELVVRLAGALKEIWARGLVSEGRRRLERALDGYREPTAARAKALNGAALLALLSQDDAMTILRAEEALLLYRSLNDPRGEADALFHLGYAAGEERDWQRAQELLERTLGLVRDLGDEHYALWVNRTLAWACAEAGDLNRAHTLYEDGLRQARKLGSPTVEAALLGSLAWLAVSEGRPEDAPPLLRQSLTIKRESGDHIEIAIGLCGSAHALATLGDASAAAVLLSSFEVLIRDIGGIQAWVTRMHVETHDMIRAHVDDASLEEARAQGRKLTLDDAIAYALSALDRQGSEGG